MTENPENAPTTPGDFGAHMSAESKERLAAYCRMNGDVELPDWLTSEQLNSGDDSDVVLQEPALMQWGDSSQSRGLAQWADARSQTPVTLEEQLAFITSELQPKKSD